MTTVLGGTVRLGGGSGVVFVVVCQLLALFDVVQQKLAATTPERLIGERGIRALDALHVDHAQGRSCSSRGLASRLASSACCRSIRTTLARSWSSSGKPRARPPLRRESLRPGACNGLPG